MLRHFVILRDSISWVILICIAIVDTHGYLDYYCIEDDPFLLILHENYLLKLCDQRRGIYLHALWINQRNERMNRELMTITQTNPNPTPNDSRGYVLRKDKT